MLESAEMFRTSSAGAQRPAATFGGANRETLASALAEVRSLKWTGPDAETEKKV